jgi:hypothetical protein
MEARFLSWLIYNFDNRLLVFYNSLNISIDMKNLSTTVKRDFLIAGLMIVAMLAWTPAGADETGTTFRVNGSDVSWSAGVGLTLPLAGSLSLDLRLTSIDTGQVPPDERQANTPPIPFRKEPGSDFRYTRAGVGLSFGF